MQEVTMILKHEAKINEGNKDTRFIYLSVVFLGNKGARSSIITGYSMQGEAKKTTGKVRQGVLF